METSPKQVLVVQQPGGCGRCYRPRSHSLIVVSVEQSEDSGWKLHDTERVSAPCPKCYNTYEAVVRRVLPIECQNYSCPDCGGLQDLDYRVQNIDKQGNAFSFQAEMRCRKCQRKKTLVTKLSTPSMLKKLEIHLTGIAIH